MELEISRKLPKDYVRLLTIFSDHHLLEFNLRFKL